MLAGRLFPVPHARRRALGGWGGLPIVGGALGLVTAGPVGQPASAGALSCGYGIALAATALGYAARGAGRTVVSRWARGR